MKKSANDSLTAVRGLMAGHATDPAMTTGVTAVLFPDGARGALEVRGGAPGTYHTDGLGMMGAIGKVGALFLSGGSLYGLDAARGLRRYVLEKGGGVRIWGAHPKLVGITGAVIFDLPGDRELEVDYEDLGYVAARNSSGEPLASGRIGAGTGTHVGKLNGRAWMMPGGIGTAAVRTPGGLTVGVIAVVNAVGDVVDPSNGKRVAGTRSRTGKGWASRDEIVARWTEGRPQMTDRGTVLVVVATDASVTRWELSRMARAANDAVARCVVPAHMASDGDIAFALTTNRDSPSWPGGEEAPYSGALADLLGLLTEEVVCSALLKPFPKPR